MKTSLLAECLLPSGETLYAVNRTFDVPPETIADLAEYRARFAHLPDTRQLEHVSGFSVLTRLMAPHSSWKVPFTPISVLTMNQRRVTPRSSRRGRLVAWRFRASCSAVASVSGLATGNGRAAEPVIR